MLHAGGEHHGRHERDGQRVGDGLVVAVEGVFVQVEAQRAVEVLEERLAEVVALADDDGVMLAQLLEVGKRGAEHRVGRHVGMAALFVVFLESRLDRGDVRHDALRRQIGHHRLECLDGVFERHGVDEQFGVEVAYLLDRHQPARVEDVLHPLDVAVENGHLVLQAHGVGKYAAHLAGSHNTYSHCLSSCLAFASSFITLFCVLTDAS